MNTQSQTHTHTHLDAQRGAGRFETVLLLSVNQNLRVRAAVFAAHVNPEGMTVVLFACLLVFYGLLHKNNPTADYFFKKLSHYLFNYFFPKVMNYILL